MHEYNGYWVGWSPPNNTNERKTLARAHSLTLAGNQSLLLALFLSACLPIDHSHGQGVGVNLVPNWSFEEFSTCDYSVGQFESTVSDWNALYMSPDYFNECHGGVFNIPDNYFGSQLPAHGHAYTGLIAKRSDAVAFQEYILVTFTSPLEQGLKYRVRLKASAADGVMYSSCCLGVILGGSSPPPPPYFSNISTAELVLTNEEMVDVTAWHQLDVLYVAQGGETKIAIGNFRPDFTTNQVTINLNADQEYSYFYIDDVEVYEDSLVTALPENIEKATAIGYEAGEEVLNVRTGERTELKLTEVTGKVVLVQQLESGRTAVPIAGLPNGVYVARVVYDSGQVVCKRVVVGR